MLFKKNKQAETQKSNNKSLNLSEKAQGGVIFHYALATY